MKVVLFILGINFAFISGQAPKDAQQLCRTDFRYRRAHDWIPYVNDTSVGVSGDVKWQILLDQYDYENLVGDGLTPPSPWTTKDFDGDTYQVCTITKRQVGGKQTRQTISELYTVA